MMRPIPGLMLAVCIAVVASVNAGPVSVREDTPEDIFFRSLSSEEQDALIELALQLVKNEEAFNEALNVQPETREVVIPDILMRHGMSDDSNQYDDAVEQDEFVRNMARWITSAWNLTPHGAEELLTTGRTCSEGVCLSISKINNICCPFG